MLLQEKRVSCSWALGTTVSDVTSHFLWPYCKYPLLLTTNLQNHSPKSIFFTVLLLPESLPASSTLFILVARYPPSLIFSQKSFKRRKLSEKEGSFHILSKNCHFICFACMLSFHPLPICFVYINTTFKQILLTTSCYCREQFNRVVISDLVCRCCSNVILCPLQP